MTNFVALRPKSYSYLTNDSNGNKKAKGIKKCAIKRECKYEDYKKCQGANQLENKINYLETYNVDVDKLKKITNNFFEKKTEKKLKTNFLKKWINIKIISKI